MNTTDPKPEVPTQNQLVLAYLLLHGSVTPAEAKKECGDVDRLAARIWIIKQKWGWPVINPGEEHGGDHPGNHARYVMDWGKPARDLGLDLPEVRRWGFEWAKRPMDLGPYPLFVAYLKAHAAVPKPKTDERTWRERLGQTELNFMGVA